MMVSAVDDACLLRVIVPTKEIVTRLRYHIRRGHRDILVPSQVHALGVIDPVIETPGAGKFGDGTLGVIENIRHIRGEEGLVSFVHSNREVGPPEECLNEGSAIVK